MLKATHGIIKPSSEPVFITGSSMITYWDFQNSSSYSGSGTTITDLDGKNAMTWKRSETDFMVYEVNNSSKKLSHDFLD